jgi:hypothetical protein
LGSSLACFWHIFGAFLAGFYGTFLHNFGMLLAYILCIFGWLFGTLLTILADFWFFMRPIWAFGLFGALLGKILNAFQR